MTLYRAEGIQAVPARKREVSDVTGAGRHRDRDARRDASGGRRPAEAVRVANHAAGIVVGKLGTAVVHPAELAADLAAA